MKKMLGYYLGENSRRFTVRLFHRLFGTNDFHSHLRLHWLHRYTNLGSVMICELGCGAGINLIELALRSPNITAQGYEESEQAVRGGQLAIQALHLGKRVVLQSLDLTQMLPEVICGADYVLLIDVLEHLPSPENTAAEIKIKMKRGASLLISVPTPLFPKVFGRRFHEDIGHLHDGFGLQDLDAMFSGIKRLSHCYSTGPLSWPGVCLYYRAPVIGSRNSLQRKLGRLVDFIKTWGALPFRYLDYWNSASVSCSLFAEYRKQ